MHIWDPVDAFAVAHGRKKKYRMWKRVDENFEGIVESFPGMIPSYLQKAKHLLIPFHHSNFNGSKVTVAEHMKTLCYFGISIDPVMWKVVESFLHGK